MRLFELRTSQVPKSCFDGICREKQTTHVSLEKVEVGNVVAEMCASVPLFSLRHHPGTCLAQCPGSKEWDQLLRAGMT